MMSEPPLKKKKTILDYFTTKGGSSLSLIVKTFTFNWCLYLQNKRLAVAILFALCCRLSTTPLGRDTARCDKNIGLSNE